MICIKSVTGSVVAAGCALALSVLTPALAEEGIKPFDWRGASFAFDVSLDATPAETWDALTGDVSGWWDHTMSGAPASLVIDPRPGGHFLEVFDAEGNGVVHADVTFAQNAKQLRLSGPFGLAGRAVEIVATLTLEAEGAGTKLSIDSDVAGHMDEGTGAIVEQVWRHFLIGRLKPYLAAGCRGGGPCAAAP